MQYEIPIYNGCKVMAKVKYFVHTTNGHVHQGYAFYRQGASMNNSDIEVLVEEPKPYFSLYDRKK